MRKLILSLISIICGGAWLHSAPLIYIGAEPRDQSSVSSISNISLNFDLSEIIAEYGEGEWGICCSGYYSKRKPAEEQSAALYKGDKDTGELIERIYTTIRPSDVDFEIGSNLNLSFADVQLETGQKYTLVLTYDMYAGKKGEETWMVDTKLSFFENPITLTFYGGSDIAKVLSMESNSIESNVQYETIPSVKITFNHDVEVTANAAATLAEDGSLVANSTNIAVDAEDSKSIVITFPEEVLYNSHKYNMVLPEGAVSVAGEPDVVNSEISIQLEGASYRYFGTGRVRPSNNSVTVLGEITIPFKFPEVEGKNYGFVALDNGDQTPFTAYLYAGNDDTTEPIETMIGTVTSDSKGLVFTPSITPEPESAYTLVIPEGNVKAYEIGAIRNTYLKDYISERVELHYTTPAVSDLPLWQPTAANITEGAELEHLDYFIVNCPDYEYDGTIYETVASQNGGLGGALYEVTADGEKEVATFRITRQTLSSESEIGNGQYNGRYFVGEVNKDLYAGKEYRVVMTANRFIVKNNFIGKYIGNSEVSITVKGAASTGLKSEFVSNIAEGQTASHLGVVSLYTTDPVAVVEGAAIELRNGENVKTAPVRIAAEEGYSHIYADFSDADHKALALDKGVEYTVVLPQGSVAHTENENLVNNEYSVKINGLAEEAVTEYISIDLTIDDFASATYRMVKGEPTVINVKGADNWELASLTLNGTDVTDKVTEAGLYEVPALDANATLDAKFEYAEEIQFMDLTTGVDTINVDGSNYTVGKDGDYVVIYNANKGDLITVYTVGGMQMASHVADNDTVKILLPGGIYIVRINNVTFKIQH